MTKVRRYIKASSVAEVLDARRTESAAAYLAGGTVLMAGDGRNKSESVIDLGAALSRDIVREDSGLDETLTIGAGATFQEMADSKVIPPFLAEACLSMVNRNTRNRATLGGNLGADKSCSSLIPILIALEADVEVASPSSPKPRRIDLEDWLRSRAEKPDPASASDLVLRVFVPLLEGRRATYRRWNRAACDLSVLGVAVAYGIEGGSVDGLRIALGGLGPKARRFPVLEALFEGMPLPAREEIEAAAAPLLKPIDDLRASAAFKRLRGAQLLADALIGASI